MRIVLAHSHANTFGGGERAVLELGRALIERHEISLLLGGFDPRRTYAELASLPHARLGRDRVAPVARRRRGDRDQFVRRQPPGRAQRTARGVLGALHAQHLSADGQAARRPAAAPRHRLGRRAPRRATGGQQPLRRGAPAAALSPRARRGRLPGRGPGAVSAWTGAPSAPYAITVGRCRPKRAWTDWSSCGASCQTCPCTWSAARRRTSCASGAAARPHGVVFRGASHGDRPGRRVPRRSASRCSRRTARSSAWRRSKPWRAACQSSPGAMADCRRRSSTARRATW